MRLITFIFFILFFTTKSKATIYTFHTAGAYTNPSNWDAYPGSHLYTNDTISIEANCWNIDLVADNGYIVFSENATEIGIDWLTLFSSDCQLQFLSNYMNISISGGINFFTNGNYNTILTPPYTFIELNNNGDGIESTFCPIWEEYVNIEYYNNGTQSAEFLSCMDGSFYNFGNIEVSWSSFDLNCDLYLANGTITGFQPFVIPPFNGTINQNCSNCTAIINNITSLYINNYSKFSGQVILNGP